MAERQSTLLKKADKQGASDFFSGSNVKAQGFRQGVALLEEGFAGYADYKGAINSSRDLEFQAKQEEIIGEQQSLAALIAFNDAQAANMVASYASGIRLQGSVTRAQTKLSRDLAFTTIIARTNADIKEGALEREARRVRAEAEYNKKIAPFKIFTGAILTYFGLGGSFGGGSGSSSKSISKAQFLA